MVREAQTISRKLTKNQDVVLSTLLAAGKPLSAYEILDARGVRRKGLTAPVTIYRALERLQDKGLVHRIESLNAFVACCHKPHTDPVAFMICDDCHAIAELPVEACRELLADTATAAGFELSHINIEVSGLCKTCRA